jgi:RND superfamily putative drug exporter
MVLLLFAMTGSLVVPVKAILANVVSLGATFGVMTAVFEHGFASGVLDTLTTGSVNPFVLVIVFAFAFGLSMDYEVFLLGRIKEYVEQGMQTDAAVRRGLQHTGRVITSAALLMVIVFGCFAAARMGNIEQIGLGLSVAVLIDATIVRCLLVPATMTLLGRWNWWAPAPLRRLHARLGLREHPLPAPDPAGPDVDDARLASAQVH